MTERRVWVVVGCSRGLGAAVVEAVLARPATVVAGLARTPLAGVDGGERWLATGRYRHHQVDLAVDAAESALAELVRALPPGPLTVVLNAASTERDTDDDGRLDLAAFTRTNRVNVDGLGRVLGACQERLLGDGGVVVGVSSVNADTPPLLEARVAYGASKAYLSMALRNLAVAWPASVRLMEARLGRVGGEAATWLVPSYAATARQLVARAARRRPPRRWTYPALYRLPYGPVLRLLPAALLRRLLLRAASRRL